MAQSSEILRGQKILEFFDTSKIDTYHPTKWPISELFKNPNQSM